MRPKFKYRPRIIRLVIRGYLFSAMWGDGFGLKFRAHRWHERRSVLYPETRPQVTYTLRFRSGEWDAILRAARREDASAYDFLKHAVLAAINQVAA